MAETTHTIMGTERLWRMPVLAITIACAIGSIALLARAWGRFAPLAAVPVACMAICAAIVAFHIVRREISVGLIPLSLFVLGFAGAASELADHSMWALACTVVVAAVFVFLHVWFVRMTAATFVAEGVSEAPVAIILGCAVRHGLPSYTLKLRLDAAVRLWRDHPDLRFIVTGGISDPSEPGEADVMADYLADAGIPAQQIIIEDRALNTEENFSRSIELMEDAGLGDTAWIVTSDYHMWRARKLARAAGLRTIPFAAPTPLSTRSVQWCREVLVICFGR